MKFLLNSAVLVGKFRENLGEISCEFIFLAEFWAVKFVKFGLLQKS